MPRAPLSLTAGLLLMIGVGGCGSSNRPVATTTSRHVATATAYRSPAGWTADVPGGWETVQTLKPTHGVPSGTAEIANFCCQIPVGVARSPYQVPDQLLPATGVSLVIGPDADPLPVYGTAPTLPLSALRKLPWLVGSAPGGAPYIEELWFRLNGRTFSVTAKIGPRSHSADLNAVNAMVRSLRATKQMTGSLKPTTQLARLVGGFELCGGAPPGRCYPQHGKVEVVSSDARVVASAAVSRSGHFSITVAPGHYTLIGINSDRVRSRASVTAVAGRTTKTGVYMAFP